MGLLTDLLGDGNAVLLTGDQTIAGAKTFTDNTKINGHLSIGRDYVGAGKLVVEGTIANVGNADNFIINTLTQATVNGFWDIYGISSQNTNQTISAGVSDTGRRVGITGDAYSNTAAFAGTLAYQIGIRGRAGFAAATTGAVVTEAAGGYFEIRNEAAGTTIDKAYGVFINNSDTSGGTITNRYDLYASSSIAKNYLAGNVGIGNGMTNPQTKLHILAGTDNAADLDAVRLQNNGENGTRIAFHNTFGPVVSIVGTKLAGGAAADEGQAIISTAVNSVLYQRMRISNDGVHMAIDDAGTVQFAITNIGVPRWSLASNAQTTVGAAGAASAPPAAPTKWLKVMDSAGTTLVIPAYAAA